MSERVPFQNLKTIRQALVQLIFLEKRLYYPSKFISFPKIFTFVKNFSMQIQLTIFLTKTSKFEDLAFNRSVRRREEGKVGAKKKQQLLDNYYSLTIAFS